MIAGTDRHSEVSVAKHKLVSLAVGVVRSSGARTAGRLLKRRPTAQRLLRLAGEVIEGVAAAFEGNFRWLWMMMKIATIWVVGAYCVYTEHA